MLSKEDNELLCRVGPGTPMGELMRQYWIPALMSTELPERDGTPLRVRLLGESLIAFRDSEGKVGLLDHACPHRGASLFFGRNEESGIRCVYHGWKFDTSGACVDMPSEPAESNFKHKVRATAYPCVERNGLIWAYLGRRAVPPPLPDLEANLYPDDNLMEKVQRECNWMQALEGDIDTSHFSFLHGSLILDPQPGTFEFYMVQDKAPRYSVLETPVGTTYGAYRPADPGRLYWRVAHFLLPFYTMVPTGALGTEVRFRAWIPMDDEHTMYFAMSHLNPQAKAAGLRAGGSTPGPVGRRSLEYLPDSSDWYGRFRLRTNASNDYLIDREAQRSWSYTGIDTGTALLQDQAITESMGSIYDRSREHLGSSDTMVIKTRQRLLGAARALQDQGTIPPGVDEPELYRMRSGGIVLPEHADWLQVTEELRTRFEAMAAS